jgi:hypothetical protein
MARASRAGLARCLGSATSARGHRVARPSGLGVAREREAGREEREEREWGERAAAAGARRFPGARTWCLVLGFGDWAPSGPAGCSI